MNKEYEAMRSMNYLELCAFLNKKYGAVSGAYFINSSCKTKNQKIKRTDEGLFIHHVYEKEAIMLSHSEYAIKFPFDWQEGENLVYCDYLEHLLLHVAIVKEYLNRQSAQRTGMVVGIGGLFNYIIPEIIDYINGYDYKQEYMKKALSVVDGNELFFVETIVGLRDFIDNNPFVKKVAVDACGGSILKYRHVFENGKMVYLVWTFKRYLEEYDVIRGVIKLINKNELLDYLDKVIECPGYDYFISVSDHGRYNHVYISYINKYGNLKSDTFAFQKTEDINEKELRKIYFKEFVYGNGATFYIRKNAMIDYKKRKNVKTSKKDYVLVVDGIDTNKYCTLDYAKKLVEKNK